MKEYSVEEILELREKVYNDFVEEYRRNKEAWDREDKTFNYNKMFLTDYSIESDNINNYENIYECFLMLKEKVKEIEEFEKNNFFLPSVFKDSFNVITDGESLDQCHYRREYMVFIDSYDEEQLREMSRRIFMDKIEELVDDGERTIHRTVDCRLVDLFLDGTISWEIIKRITSHNCEFLRRK